MTDRPRRPSDDDLRQRRWPAGGGEPIDKAMVAGEAFALRYIGDALVHLADIISSTPGPGLRDGIRERPCQWPTDSGDPVESRNLHAAPHEVGDDPASSDGSTATHGPAVGTGESPVTAHHRVIPLAGSNLCVCGEWFDAEVHAFPEPVRFWNVGHDDPHNHYPWTWTPNLAEHGGPVLGSIHTPNGPRPDGGMHAYWAIAHNIWEPTGRLICKLVNRWAHDHFGTLIPLADADFGEMGQMLGRAGVFHMTASESTHSDGGGS